MTGDDKRIRGFGASGIKIDKTLAPAGLPTKDRVSIVEAVVVEVAALPHSRCMMRCKRGH